MGGVSRSCEHNFFEIWYLYFWLKAIQCRSALRLGHGLIAFSLVNGAKASDPKILHWMGFSAATASHHFRRSKAETPAPPD